MKTRKYYLFLAVVVGILCAPAPGATEHLSSAYMPALPDLSASAGVVVMISPAASNIEGLPWGKLNEEVLQRIIKAGIKRYSGPIRGSVMHIDIPVSILRIDIDMLMLDDLQQYVLRIQTSLAAEVSLASGPKCSMKADIWWTAPEMQVVSIKDMPAKVTEVVLHQVDKFVESYLAANPPGAHVGDVNDVNVVSMTGATKRAWRVGESRPAEYKFVASKNSKVFHKAGCTSAGRIKPENLVGYSTRDEAIEAGKKPCKQCNP
jgi:hypothetical protein